MSKKPNPPGRCIFCGSPGLTREHIWSEWTYKYVPRQAVKHDRIRSATSRGDPRISGIKSVTAHNGSVNTIKLKVVCRSCNNGWMSRIDEAAKRVLIPLITGSNVLLTELDQRLLAAWVAMKIMVCEFEERENVSTPQAERDYLMRTQTAPDGWQIWIARHTDHRWTNSFRRNSVTLFSGDGPPPPGTNGPKNTQAVVFGIGWLLVQLVSSTLPWIKFDHPPEQRHILRPLWPYVGEILWPPIITISPTGIERIRNSFNQFISTVPWTPPGNDGTSSE